MTSKRSTARESVGARFTLAAALIAACACNSATDARPEGVWGNATTTEELAIGVDVGGDEYMLGSVRSIAVAADGTIYAADLQPIVVRAYTSDGAFLRTIGRQGRGPGEYNGTPALRVLSNRRSGRIVRLRVVPEDSMSSSQEQRSEVSFATADGGTVFAHLYDAGSRSHAVVLAHGAVFDKESWEPLATTLAAAGYLVLAIDFRGYGKSVAGSDRGALHHDVLAAVRYLAREHRARVSVLGGSMGGGAAAQAAVEAEPGEIDRLILLSAVAIARPDAMKAASFLFIGSEDEAAAGRVREQFGRAPEPKRLEMQTGNAHAQHIFRTDLADALTALIVDYLDEARRTR